MRREVSQRGALGWRYEDVFLSRRGAGVRAGCRRDEDESGVAGWVGGGLEVGLGWQGWLEW